jgi:hypothetical protein
LDGHFYRQLFNRCDYRAHAPLAAQAGIAANGKDQ